MKEAQFVSILAHRSIDFCSEVISSQDKKLCLAFSLKGENANGFAKDISDDVVTWEIEDPEHLHHNILDLLTFVRQQKLEIEFALSVLFDEQIVFAAFSGEVILKRNGQHKKILTSNNEVKIVVGNFKENDQIILANRSAIPITDLVEELLRENASLEKIVSEATLLQEEHKSISSSIAFLTYKETSSELNKKKIDFKQILSKLHEIRFVVKKIPILIKKIISFVKKILLYLKRQNKKKLLIVIASIIIFLLITFASVSIFNKQNIKTTSNIQEKIIAIQNETKNIEVLVLNEPLQAREKAQQSLDEVKQLKEEKNNKESLKLIDDEISRLESLIQRISGENSLDKLSVVYNLNDFLANKIEFKNNEIFALENNGQEILRIKANGTQEKINAVDQTSIRDFTVSENRLFILSNGIRVMDLDATSNGFESIKEEGESDRTGEFFSSFGPYLYLSNKEKRNVYRYYYNDGKLSDPIGWLVDKNGINFDNISGMTVDGDLWMAFKNGNLLKFSKGYSADFNITGLGEAISNQIAICTNENTNSIAILEKANKRLLILTKDGQLISEIKSNELAGVSSIAFNSDASKVYALSGSVIYEVAI